MNYHPSLAGVYRMSPLCAHGEDLHSPFIGTRLLELLPRDTRRWGPFYAGFHPLPRSRLRHHSWRPPASCLPGFLLFLFCACHPPPLPPRNRRAEFPLLLLTGNPFLTPLLFGLCLFLAPPSECNRSLPVTFFPAFLPLEEGLACAFRRFYLLLCFLWPLLPPVCSDLYLRISHITLAESRGGKSVKIRIPGSTLSLLRISGFWILEIKFC